MNYIFVNAVIFGIFIHELKNIRIGSTLSHVVTVNLIIDFMMYPGVHFNLIVSL